MSMTPVTGTSLQPLPIRIPAAPAATATAQTQAPSAVSPAPAEPAVQEALNLQTPAQAGSAAQSVGFIDAATTHDPASPAELRWAKNLEQRVEQGYQPTPEEIELYQEIYQKVQAAPPAPQPDPTDSTETGVSQQELQWALDLEEKVKMGYQPTQQEIKAYQDIAVRVAHGPIEGKKPELPPEVSQQEVDWALQLEKKVLQGYVPQEDEIKKYQDIANRLSKGGTVETPEPAPPVQEPAPVSQAEVQWARELMKHVEAGYAPTPEEAARYNEIYSRLQATQHQQVNQAELDWAQQLQSKVEQGYQPSAAEVKQYEKIYQRYQEQNQVKPSLYQAPPAAPADSTAPVQDSSAVQEPAPAPVLPKSSASAMNFGVGRWTRQA